MSSKSTIFLTNENEHCYFELLDETIVLEMKKSNIEILINDDEDLIIEIKPDCDFYKLIKTITQL